MRNTESTILERLYRDNYRRVFLYIYSLCKDREMAEDITEETFLKALMTLPDTHINPVAWLYTVAKNLLLDEFRRQKKQEEFTVDAEPVTAPDPVVDGYIRDERYRELYRALDRLDETDRQLIELFYFSGLSQKDIAGVTGFSLANVRVRISRAKQKLKDLLPEE